VTWQLILAIAVAATAIESIRRGLDVRFVLFAAGLVLVASVGEWWTVFDTFQKYLGRADIVGPICAAMGYAWVLKATGCDGHMVRLLMQPLRRYRWALVPGGCAVGFLANMAMTSQTACAAAVGPVLIPLMIAAGYRPIFAAATLVVGCSVGGNLFNPGEPDIVAINAVTGWLVGPIIDRTVIPNLISFVVATTVLSVMGHRFSSGQVASHQDAAQPVRLVYALLPPLPVVLLMLLQPGLNLVPPLFAIYPGGVHVSMVMLVCAALVLVVTRQNAWSGHIAHITKEFFNGMGYAFANVISLIIAAGCFIAGLDAVGAIKGIAGVLLEVPTLATALSPMLTAGLAYVSGSGTAPSVAFTQAMLPNISLVNPSHAVDLGVLGAIGASVGRTMSPVAAVVLFAATLVEMPPIHVVRLTRWPMLAALVAVIAAALVF
jgi:DcuC family C4-dicarboxylate transporter